MTAFVDTHCHLNFNYFDEDRAAVLARARESGVERILNPGTDLASSRAAIQLAEANHGIYAAVGIHPNDASTWETGTQAEVRQLANHPKVVAIGEIGLDYYWDRAAPDLQERIFRQQLDLAAETGLPVILHTRNKSREDHQAMLDMLSILESWQGELEAAGLSLAERPGVLHSYSDQPDLALRAIQRKFYIGITGPVTFRNAQDLRETVISLPLENLLIETDAPFLTPHPHRGERNEPAYVRFVAEKIAEIRSLPLDVVAEQTAANARRLFNHWRENA